MYKYAVYVGDIANNQIYGMFDSWIEADRYADSFYSKTCVHIIRIHIVN